MNSRELWSFLETKLGSSYVGDCVKLKLSVRPLAEGPGSILGVWTSLLETILYDGMPCSKLMQIGGAYSCHNLMCQTFLTPDGSSYPLEGVGVDMEWGGGEVRGAGGEVGRELWLECKTK